MKTSISERVQRLSHKINELHTSLERTKLDKAEEWLLQAQQAESSYNTAQQTNEEMVSSID